MCLYIVTGFPGSGKTTLIERLLADLSFDDIKGFVTREVRRNSIRVGFDIHTLDDEHAPLARTGPGSPRVGKYAVDIESFNEVAVRTLEVGLEEESCLLVVDEVGKMELFSERFRDVMRRVIEDGRPLLATVPMRSTDPLVEGLKRHQRSRVWQVDRRSFLRTLCEVKDAIRADLGETDSGI